MKKKFIVVSAYGRGHWLAVQLKRLGIQVVLMDVTEKLGAWIPEEAEGPFGFFYSDRILESQMERLYEDDELIEARNGFLLWLQDGPVEFKGITTKQRFERMLITEEVIKAIMTNSVAEKIKNKSFAEKWLALFAHQYAANRYFSTVDSFENRYLTPLFSTFFTRYSSRIGHEKSLSWVERQQVEVLRGAEILDISMNSRREMRGIEYRTAQTESSQIYEADFVIWNLTSEETSMFGPKPISVLYSKGLIEPIWYWARYRLRLTESFVRESLPTHTVLIGTKGVPWTHENLMILQRTGARDLFDVWMRLPNVQRFNKDYLFARGNYLVEKIKEKLIMTDVEIVNQPVGFEETFHQSGSARHPIFDPFELNHWGPSQIQNIYFDSAEQWPALGLNGMFDHQTKILNEIQLWWKNLLLKQNKGVEL